MNAERGSDELQFLNIKFIVYRFAFIVSFYPSVLLKTYAAAVAVVSGVNINSSPSAAT
jgi:hypothetical protein